MSSKYGCDIDSGQLDTSRYSAPMPIVGLYAALASLACLLLASVDTFTGFKSLGNKPRHKFWFPCKWFGINATTLALLSIATKLPADLNTAMPGPHHQLAKLTGTVMLSVAMVFFLPCFGKMEIKDKLSNVIALILLILTVAVDISIQLTTGVIFTFRIEHVIVLCFLLFMTVNIFITAISSVGVKDALDKRFRKVSKACMDVLTSLKCSEERPDIDVKEGIKSCKEVITRRLYMKHTKYARDMEYVIIRSPNGSTMGVLSILSALVLVEAEFRALLAWQIAKGRGGRSWKGITSLGLHLCRGNSDYKWSVWLLLASQTIFVILVVIPILLRWFESIRFVRHPLEEMLSCRYLRVELKRLTSSYNLITNNMSLNSSPGGAEIRCTSIGNFLRSMGLFLLAMLQVPTSYLSRMISRISSFPHCCVFWLFGDALPPPLDQNVLVHLEDEDKDFHYWMSIKHKKDVDKAMQRAPTSRGKLTILHDPDVQNYQRWLVHGKLLDPFDGLLRMPIEFKNGKLIETVLEMVQTVALAKVEKSDEIEKCEPNLEDFRTDDMVDAILRYIDLYGLGKPTKPSSNAGMDSPSLISESPREPFGNYMQLVSSSARKLSLYSSAKFGEELLPDKLQECYVAGLMLFLLTYIFDAAYQAISPSETNLFEDDIQEREIRDTMDVLRVLGEFGESLPSQLKLFNRHASCTLRKVVIANGKPMPTQLRLFNSHSVSPHRWQEHKSLLIRRSTTLFPRLEELFINYCRNPGRRLQTFGIAIAWITLELALEFDGDKESRATTKEFICSLEEYWRILYYIDVSTHSELREQLVIEVANNVDNILGKALAKRLQLLESEFDGYSVPPPQHSVRSITEIFNRIVITKMGCLELLEEQLESGKNLLERVLSAIYEDIIAGCRNGVVHDPTILIDDLKKQILLVIFSALPCLFPAICGHILNVSNPTIHELLKLPSESDRNAFAMEQLPRVEQSAWFKNTKYILTVLQEGDLLACLASFYRPPG